MSSYQLFDLSGLGIINGAVVAILLFEAGLCFWHRTMHTHATLWRVFHQMPHSAERVDTFGTFYVSSLEAMGFTFLGSLCGVLIIGVAPQSISIFLLATTFLAIFQHTNIRTPQWLSDVLQRPESHGVHHARKVHFKDFSDLPVFDILLEPLKTLRI